MIVDRGGKVNDNGATSVFEGVDLVKGEEGVSGCIFGYHTASCLGDHVEERLAGGVPGQEGTKKCSSFLADVGLPNNEDQMVSCAEETMKVGRRCVSNVCEDVASACFRGNAENAIDGRFGVEVEDIIIDRTIGTEGWVCGGAASTFEEGIGSLIGGNLNWFQRYRVNLLEVVAIGCGDEGLQGAAERRCVAGQSWVISNIRNIDVSARCIAMRLNPVAECGFEGAKDDLAWIRPEAAAW